MRLEAFPVGTATVTPPSTAAFPFAVPEFASTPSPGSDEPAAGFGDVETTLEAGDVTTETTSPGTAAPESAATVSGAVAGSVALLVGLLTPRRWPP
jgi:hypothetical protein